MFGPDRCYRTYRKKAIAVEKLVKTGSDGRVEGDHLSRTSGIPSMAKDALDVYSRDDAKKKPFCIIA